MEGGKRGCEVREGVEGEREGREKGREGVEGMKLDRKMEYVGEEKINLGVKDVRVVGQRK